MRGVESNDWYLVIVPILIGTGMLCFWVFVVVANRVPEIESGGIEIRFPIVAEVTTGLVLITGGRPVLIASPAREMLPRVVAPGCDHRHPKNRDRRADCILPSR
jgi:hypothetical protein